MKSMLNVTALLAAIVSLLCHAAQAQPTPVPSGIVAWWKGEQSVIDSVAGRVAAGNAPFTEGKVGSAFDSGVALQIVDVSWLPVEEFTAEAWIRRSGPTVTDDPGGNGDAAIFAQGTGGWGIKLNPDGFLGLTRVDYPEHTIDYGAGVVPYDDTWYHVAVTFNHGFTTFYINGISYGEQYILNPETGGPLVGAIWSDAPAGIGMRGDNFTGRFNGAIDELSIYNRALTPEEITAIYNADSFGKEFLEFPSILTDSLPDGRVGTSYEATVGVALPYVIGRTPQSFGIAISNAYHPLLSVAVTAGELPPGLINNGSSITGTPTTPGTYVFSITILDSQYRASAPKEITLVIVPTPAMVAWWKAENNSTDSVQGLTTTGSTGYSLGKVGNAFWWPALVVNDSTSLHFQSFTIEAWFAPADADTGDGSNGSGPILTFGTGGYGLWFTPGNYLNNIDDGFTLTKVGFSSVTFFTPPQDTAWRHIAVTKSRSGRVTFYSNGVSLGSPNTLWSDPFTFNTSLGIGVLPGSQGQPNCYLKALIDELSIYNGDLTASEIAAIYNAGSAGK